MTHTRALLLAALTFAFAARQLVAADPPAAPSVPASGVCTDGSAPAVRTGGKHIWADSRLYTDAPPLEVQKWLTDKPEMDGKFLVIEFWRTWCGACKRMTPLMNTLHKKYGQELVVIGITGEEESVVKAYAGPKKEYVLALDQPRPANDKKSETKGQPPENRTDAGQAAAAPDQAEGPTAERPGQGLYEAGFGVWGWPHVIILEPQYRTVVWEGFPGLKGHELTEAKVAKMLAIGRAVKEEEKAKKK